MTMQIKPQGKTFTSMVHVSHAKMSGICCMALHFIAGKLMIRKATICNDV